MSKTKPKEFRIVMRQAVFLLIVSMGALLLAACGGGGGATPVATQQGTAAEFYVNPYKDECTINGELTLCYVASSTSGGEFKPYAGAVENFEFEWGHGYTLSGSGDASTFRVDQILNDVPEPGGVHFPMTVTGGGDRIVAKGDGLYEIYSEKTFTCDPTASCETLDQVIGREQPIDFEFQTPDDPTGPLLLLSWDSAAIPAQVGEEPGLIMKNDWQLQSVTTSKDSQQLALAGTAVTADFTLDDTFSTGTVSGNAGCNDYSADVTISGNAITITNLKRGEIQCNNPPGIMEQEQGFLSALTVTQDFLVDGERLQLNYNSGDSALHMIVAP